MPPKINFSKDNVIQSAFEIVQKDGIKMLTARKVAEKLKSSTAPVYSYFKSMYELKREIIKKARDLLFQYTKRPYTERVFLNIGTGYVIFARDNNELFRAIFLEKSDFKDIIDEFIKSLRKEMIKDPRFTVVSAKDRNALLNNMWIFTHGLASLICVGLIENNSNKYIIDKLSEVGSSVIGATLAKYENK